MSPPVSHAAPSPTPSVGARPTPPPAVRLGAFGLARWQLRHDLRAGEFRLLVLAIVLAVAAFSAVAFYADRLQAALARDAAQLLGGDVVVASDQRLAADWRAQAQAAGLKVSESATFVSMARHAASPAAASSGAAPPALKLAALKAVDAAYPLRGTLGIARAPGAPTQQADGGPPPGSVWVDAALLDALGLAVGDVLALGDSALRIDAVLRDEPDRGAGFMNFAPRVLLRLDDLAATSLDQGASRLSWRLAAAAPAALPRAAARDAVQRFERWAKARLAPLAQAGAASATPSPADAAVPRDASLRGVRLESLEGNQPAMQQTLQRAQGFLKLVAMLAALLSAVAVAMAARDFAQRRLDTAAMLRVLGAPQRTMAAAMTLGFVAVGLVASAIGVGVGLAVHLVFAQLLAGLVGGALPAPGLVPAAMGLALGMTLLLGFALPPVLQLAQVPPLRVLRRELGTIRAGSLLVWAAGLAGFVALLLAAADDPKLGALAVGGFAVAALVFALVGRAAIALAATLAARAPLPRWAALATRQVAARPQLAVVQIGALGVGMLALVLLVLLRTDLIDAWRRATPPDAPDRFVVNVQPEQGDAFRAALRDARIERYDWFPMIRGRLVAVNGRAVGGDSYVDARAQRLADREFNLSHAAQLPAHNTVVAGRWVAEEADGVSVEQGLAKTLGWQLGDRVEFDVGGQRIAARVTSLRAVDWGSLRVNFFVMFPRATLADVPATYISAFRAPAGAAGVTLDRALGQAFPNLTLVDLTQSIAQAQRVLDQVIRAVEVLFLFSVGAGLVVLVASVASTREHRAHQLAVMRALGAQRALLTRMQQAELLGVGALAGALASVGALLLGAQLAQRFFGFDWAPAPWVPLAGAAAGAALAWAAGWPSLRGVLRRPVMETLRNHLAG